MTYASVLSPMLAHWTPTSRGRESDSQTQTRRLFFLTGSEPHLGPAEASPGSLLGRLFTHRNHRPCFVFLDGRGAATPRILSLGSRLAGVCLLRRGGAVYASDDVHS